MKTIFRYTHIGLLVAAIFALGAVATFAQNDPCADAEGKATLDAKFRDNYAKKDIASRKLAIAGGKEYVEKYGGCPDSEEFVKYLNNFLPGMEKAVKDEEEKTRFNALLTRFDVALKGKNWDEVYTAGKQILAEKPDEYRDAELVLGSVGLIETEKTPRVTKWNDETILWAKQAIADLEAGKKFTTYGVSITNGVNFKYDNKDNAIAWMNYTIAFINFYDKKNKKEALNYFYKASLPNSDLKTNPLIYELIGSYYFDDVQKLVDEVKALAAAQLPGDTPEVAAQKVEAINAKIAMVNGTAEAAIDGYARAYSLAKKNPKSTKAYNDGLYKVLEYLYNTRYGKTEGLDEAFIAKAVAKPVRNPSTPVAPISDQEPTTTTTTTSTSPAMTPSTTPKPAVTTTVKPVPATKPVSGVKPQAVVKKSTVKRKGV